MGEETDTQLPKITKESEPEDEATSILPKLVVFEQVEMAKKSFGKETDEVKYGGKIMPEKEVDIKEADEEESQKSETQSVPDDLSTYIKDETLETEIQEELYMESESSVIDTKEGQRHMLKQEDEPQSEGQRHMLKQEDEPQSEVQDRETTIVMHLIWEEKTTGISPTNETEEQEKIPASPTKQNLEIEDDGRFILEEVKVMEEATQIQLLETASECVPKDKAISPLSSIPSARVEKVEESFQEETKKEAE